MSGVNRKICCRFCKKTVPEYELNLAGDITRQMLDALLFKLNFDVGNQILICNECAKRLQNAAVFKTHCLSSERKIQPFLNSDRNIELVSVTSGEKLICHFCRRLTENDCYTYLDDKKEHIFLVDMVKKHIPELVNSDEELITCKSCLASLQDLSGFIRICLDTEERNNMVIASGTNMGSQQILTDIENFSLKYQVMSDDVDIDKMERGDKQEDITVKNELKVESVGNEDLTERDNLELLMENKELIKMQQLDWESFRDAPTLSSRSIMTNINNNSNDYVVAHPAISEAVVHNLESLEKTEFTENYKWNVSNTERKLTNHKIKNLKHTEPTEWTIYEPKRRTVKVNVLNCDQCSYKTKYKYILKTHLSKHRELPEVKVYKCESCSYVTRRKSCLKAHMLTHRELSEVTVYNCEICSYVTKYKGGLKRHNMLTHGEFAEVTVYNCEVCSFVTKYKCSLKVHKLTHQEHSELYKCQKCSFVTEQQSDLKSHVMVHQELSEVTLYHCDQCAYKTKDKYVLKTHLLRHQELSGVTVSISG